MVARFVGAALIAGACMCGASWAATEPSKAPRADTEYAAPRPTRWLAPDLGVSSFVFGLPVDDHDDQDEYTEIVEHDRVPLVEGQAYGWRLFVRTGRDRVRVREVLTLPAAPATWGGAEESDDAALSADRRTITVEHVANARSSLTHWWSVAPGDPSGRYELRVYLDGMLAGEATFVVGEK